MNQSNKISHQVRISEREAFIVSSALYWFAHKHPSVFYEAMHYYRIFDRVEKIIKDKKSNFND